MSSFTTLFKSLFPADDFSLIAVILGMPLLGALVNGVWGRRLGKEAVRVMALAAIGVSFLASVLAFLMLDRAVGQTVQHVAGQEGHGEFQYVRFTWTVWEWMATSTRDGGNLPIEVKFLVDPLNAVMMLVVTGVGFLIHWYATAYMAEDKAYWRFFAYLNLFVFSMLVLILGDNLPILFVGWEGVGLCSYLLIGFWYPTLANAQAGKKAFLANRVGDFGLLSAMFLLVYYTGALDWNGIQNGAQNLVTTNPTQQVNLWPLGGAQYQGVLKFLQPTHTLTILPATAVGLALLLGCTGKSAQIPLYVWLPDAMAGPTPVSALIHAATMVTAGIYLVCRMSAVFVLSPFVMATIAGVGALTAFLAATIALVQNDIKKVLAYSTVSQLGFMFIGVGVGAFTAGFFHVFTHAFFKACLFLGAGSVIHAMHARIHDGDQSQDIRNMGGLREHMPLTFWTFVASVCAISGVPGTSGFFSKDEILFRAWVSTPANPNLDKLEAAVKSGALHTVEPLSIAPWFGKVVFGLAILAATMTAFYMFRLLFVVFFGEFRGWKIGRPSLLSARGQGHDDHHDDLSLPGHAPHESPTPMTVPLIILGTAAVAAGIFNAPLLHLTPMEHWLDPVFRSATEKGVKLAAEGEALTHLEHVLVAPGVLAFLVGGGLAYWMYVAQNGEPARKLAEAWPKLHSFLMNKWYVDEAYDATAVSAVDALAETAASVDQSVIDLAFARLTALFAMAMGTILRVFQNGVVHTYAAFMALGLAALGLFYCVPHAEASVTLKDGDYVIQAAPGLGYTYRWDADGNGTPDTDAFGAQREVKVHLEADQTRVVRLEVTNAFQMKGTKEITLAQKPKLEAGQN